LRTDFELAPDWFPECIHVDSDATLTQLRFAPTCEFLAASVKAKAALSSPVAETMSDSLGLSVAEAAGNRGAPIAASPI